jgi:hypothetical protein
MGDNSSWNGMALGSENVVAIAFDYKFRKHSQIGFITFDVPNAHHIVTFRGPNGFLMAITFRATLA